CLHGSADRRPDGSLASLTARHHQEARGRTGTIHRRRAAARRRAERGHQAPQASGAGRSDRARKAGPGGPYIYQSRAPPARLRLGSQVRALLERTPRSVRAAFQGHEEGEEAMTKSANTIEINVQRTIPAPPGEVFDAWLDPRIPGNPWNAAEKF